jgi:hypothetical protein
VTTVGRFKADSGQDSVLARVGAISRLSGVRYWSTTGQRWRTMIAEAHALTGAPGGQRRRDFAPAELTPGTTIYFEQDDNLAGKAVYLLHIAEATGDRIVFGIENTSSLRYLGIPVWQAGEMQLACFLDREPDGVWRYYSMLRTGKHVNATLAGNESSAMNRALAYYRSLAGIPTDREPPAAR